MFQIKIEAVPASNLIRAYHVENNDKKKNSGNLAAHDREINSHVVLPIDFLWLVCSAMEG